MEGSWTAIMVMPFTMEKTGKSESGDEMWGVREGWRRRRAEDGKRVAWRRVLWATFALTAGRPLKRDGASETGIRPDFVRRALIVGSFTPSSDPAAALRSHDAEPMVGWPAKGSSVSVAKMSMRRSPGGESDAAWRKTVSERLNSRAMSCFWACVRGVEVVVVVVEGGRRTIARGFPEKGDEVKTSVVMKLRWRGMMAARGLTKRDRVLLISTMVVMMSLIPKVVKVLLYQVSKNHILSYKYIKNSRKNILKKVVE